MAKAGRGVLGGAEGEDGSPVACCLPVSISLPFSAGSPISFSGLILLSGRFESVVVVGCWWAELYLSGWRSG